MELKIGISGKRDIKLNDQQFIQDKLKQQIIEILKIHKTSRFIGVSSLAKGADTIFADIVVNTFNCHLEVVLPFGQEEYEEDFSEDDKVRFRQLLNVASHVKVLKSTGSERDYLAAGTHIVQEVQEMIFVWDNQPARGRGGTADIIGYYDFHNSSRPAHVIQISSSGKDDLITDIEREFSESDEGAKQLKKRHDLIWQQSLFAGWIAVVFFAFKTGFEVKGIFGLLLVYAEFLALIVVGILVYYGHRQQIHHRFLKNRVRAEQLRLLLSLYRIGFDSQIPMLVDREDKKLKRIYEAATQPRFERVNQPVYYSRMVFLELITSQIDYHSHKINSIGKTPKKFEYLKLTVGFLFFANLLTHFVMFNTVYFKANFELPHWLEHLSLALSILLPATYAVVEGAIFFNDWGKIKSHSVFVKQNLEESQIHLLRYQIGHSSDELYDGLQTLLPKVGNILFTENNNWQIITEEKANYHWIT